MTHPWPACGMSGVACGAVCGHVVVMHVVVYVQTAAALGPEVINCRTGVRFAVRFPRGKSGAQKVPTSAFCLRLTKNSSYTLIEREVSDKVYLTYRDLDGWRGRCARVFMLTGQGSRSAELLIAESFPE
jgi:hypothetical protein